MCKPIKLIGLLLFLSGLGMLLGILIPCNTFLLAVIFIGIGLIILLN